MKELYEKPEIDYVSFQISETITSDEGGVGGPKLSTEQGVEEW